jgi:hypothetical protein
MAKAQARPAMTAVISGRLSRRDGEDAAAENIVISLLLARHCGQAKQSTDTRKLWIASSLRHSQ